MALGAESTCSKTLMWNLCSLVFNRTAVHALKTAYNIDNYCVGFIFNCAHKY